MTEKASNMRNSDFTIDLDKVFDASKKGKKIPRWVRTIVRKFIHLDEINEYLAEGKRGAEFCKGAVRFLDIQTEIVGLENLDHIPEGKHCTIVSNHPLGGIDGITIIAMLNEKFGDNIRLLANSFLLEMKGLAPVCIPINKMGGQSRSLPAAIKEAYDSENEMLIFPAGACSRRYDGKIQDCAWGKSFISHSVRTGRYIVPIHFIAKNSKRFYIIDSLFRALHIKFNIGMFMLPGEMIRGKHKKIKMIIGKPIAPEHFDDSKSASEWAQELRSTVYTM